MTANLETPRRAVDASLVGFVGDAARRERTTVLAPEPKMLGRLRRLGFLGGLVVILHALGVVIGWATGSEVLISLNSGNNQMSLLTAIALLALGVSVCLVNSDRTRYRAYLTGALLLPIIVISIWAIGSEMLHLPAGPLLDGFGLQPPFPDGLQDLRHEPTPVASILMLALSSGLLLAQIGWARTGQSLMFLSAAISLMALQGYLMDLPVLYDWGGAHPMALKTSAMGLLVSFCAMVAEAGKGFVALVTSNSAGGRVSRALFPLVVTLPMLVAEFAARAVSNGLVSPRGGIGLFSVAATIITGMVTWWLSVSLRGVDVERVSARAEASEFRRLLSERDALAEELSAANADLEAFAAIAAHDLRSPLVAIRGYAELLHDDPTLVTPEGQRWLDKIMTGADRGAVLIAELLAYSRASSSSEPLQPIDLTELARSVAADSSHPEAVRVRPLAGVMGEELMLRQLMTNLIENSLKYMPPDRQPEVVVDALITDEWVTVRVSDNGDGIPEQDRTRLLQMFERGSQQVEGSGVGLAICARVATRHGGRLWIEDADGGGARVCVSLRAAGPNPSPEQVNGP